VTTDGGWNHNIHYHPVVLAAVPAAARRALDVGCGDGALARKLRARIGHVMALDLDEPSLAAARAADRGLGVDYVLGDFRTLALKPASFDFICSVAALHHMDAAAALERMADLLRPGGRLVIVGLARIGNPRDVPLALGGMVAHRILARRHGHTEVTAPTVWPPPVTYGGMRRIAGRQLPGSRFRRRLLYRYTLTWDKPGGAQSAG
jgi:SAM-dependent methyltransferase